MNRTAFCSALFSTLLLVSLSAFPGSAAATLPTPIFPNVVGLWSGEYVSSVMGTSGFVSLDVTGQVIRRFQATWTFTPSTPIVPPSPCFVLGTVSDSGEVSLVGWNDEFMLQAHGQLANDVMALGYAVQFADGSFDDGTLQMSSIVIGDGGP